jgi:hypothetical protein
MGAKSCTHVISGEYIPKHVFDGGLWHTTGHSDTRSGMAEKKVRVMGTFAPAREW